MRELSYFNSLSLGERALIIRKLRTDVRKLEKLFAESGTPKAAAEKFVKTTSYKRASETVASLINECAWDARICPVSKAWARRVEGAWDAKSVDKMGVSSLMHRSHLDAIAYEMARCSM